MVRIKDADPSKYRINRNVPPLLESLESRLLLSESATAQLHLVSTAGTSNTYDITLTDTGTTPLGTFWFAWVPGEDFLPTRPSSATSPPGWGNAAGTSSTPAFTGSNNSFDGTAIQWVAQSTGAAIQPGQSLSSFEFTTQDTPAQLAADAPTHAGSPVMTSFVYSGLPFSDAGFQFDVTQPAPATIASVTTLAASAPSVVAGNAVTFTATVTPATPGTPTPTGIVNFVENGATLGSGTLQSNGTASFTTSSLAAGSHNITADYLGDATYSSSTSSAATETVTPAPVVGPLTATFPKLTLASSVVSGSKTNAKATVVVANNAGTSFKGQVTIVISANLEGVVTPIQTVHPTLSIKAHHSIPVTINLVALPAIANGTYTIAATITDPSHNTTSTAFATPIRIAAPFVALAASARLVSAASIAPGKQASVAISLTNAGNINSTGTMTITFSLLAVGIATPLPVLVANPTVKTTAATPLHLRFKIPLGFAAGTYSLTATITQAGQTLSTAPVPSQSPESPPRSQQKSGDPPARVAAQKSYD